MKIVALALIVPKILFGLFMHKKIGRGKQEIAPKKNPPHFHEADFYILKIHKL